MALLTVVAGACDTGLSSSDPETAFTVRRGQVSDVEGNPIAGARVFWSSPGLITGGGPLLVPDSAISDATGAYRLETTHYCNSQLAARADGYQTRRSSLSYLQCPDNQPTVVNIVLTPEAAGGAAP